MVQVVSSGILVVDDHAELLLCHATGTPRWDIPKGVGEPGESAIETAVREAEEETGLVFEPADLTDLGRFPYLRAKDLHLHAVLVERIDLARCRCSTLVPGARGRLRPEMDAYAWVAFDAIGQRVGKSLQALLRQRLDLRQVLADLQVRAGRDGPARWRWSPPVVEPRPAK
jgi:8-oxo-dGTP pyrophosphatase MutT (NUDIX family)